MLQQRNATIDVLKLMASYMVVFLHITFYGAVGVAVKALARFAVPFFFLISGFYSFNLPSDKFIKRIKHIIFLFIFSVMIYMFWNAAQLLFIGDFRGIFAYFAQYLNFKNLIKFLCFNVTISSVHLWYLSALIYVYVVFYFLFRFKVRDKFIFIVSFLLLFLHLFLGEFLSIFGFAIPATGLRNFVFMGIPFFGIGMFVKKYEDRFKIVNKYIALVCFVIGAFCTFCSRHFLGKNELYIGSLFILLAMIIVFLKYPNAKYPKFIMRLAKCSTYIYILHMLISKAIIKLYPIFEIDYYGSVFLRFVHPIIVCLVSTVLAYCITCLSGKSLLKKQEVLE